jgi:hypothetical protein
MVTFRGGYIISALYLNAVITIDSRITQKPGTREQLVARIQDAFEDFRNDFPRFPWQDSMDRRLAACTEAGGGHFENILD